MRRTEGASKVTGDLVFTEDLPVVGLAHASLVTSYVPSGAIRNCLVSTNRLSPTRAQRRK